MLRMLVGGDAVLTGCTALAALGFLVLEVEVVVFVDLRTVLEVQVSEVLFDRH